MIEVEMLDQEAKKDAGKPRLSLVPTQIIYDICKVREFAVDHKYKNPDNWKNVDIQRYRDAAYRHFLLYLRDPDGVDEESGLPHYYHLCCNLAFICEIEAGNVKQVDTKKELKLEPGKRAETSCYDEWLVDFDEPAIIPFEGVDKPKYTGKYEFSFYGKEDWTEGYYILDYDIVVDEKGLKMHPNYWRHM